jgi:hypothetical protein
MAEMMVNDGFGKGCFLPLAQAIGTSLFLGGIMAGVAAWQRWENVGYISLITGAAAGMFWWVSSLELWRREVYRDPVQLIDQPRVIQPSKVRIELVRDEGRSLDFIDLPIDQDRLIPLARGVLAGEKTLSETGTSGILTRSEFTALRAELIRRGLAAWNNPHTPARGVSLTRGGQAAFRSFAMMTGSPTLPGRIDPQA